MDAASSDVARHEESAGDGVSAPGDLGRALDDLTAAYDDERVRRVIEALIHPGTAAARAPAAEADGRAAAPSRAPSIPAPRAADRTGDAADALGLCRSDVWHRLLEVEHACAARYSSQTTVVQLEVSEIAVIATVLGETAANRLIGVLADTVRADTRGADSFSRIGRWRIAGLLPYTDGRTADAAIRRIAEGFSQRLGDGLPIRLAVGRAEVDPSLDPQATLARAEGAMTSAPRRPADSGAGRGRADAQAGAGPDGLIAIAVGPGDSVGGRDGRSRRSTDLPVPDSLRELERLRADGLVSDDEYRKTRRRILRRI